ncbi:hypothetical protein E2562_022293 [Oryza meyeriana var. granulata]|uniref:Eukaryotic translation initiation factor 3 subunit E n=1 Tax=Oryza meyeriana var. granulata TaxID=110450 RepID=A0A6G1D658_9ORYZ|nr:hypothetical protein E2562_022293 [Oryza meyeriana var. granulata]
MAAEHDLTARMAGHMDCHLVFQLLDFLQERQLYADEEIFEAKIRLLRGTNMADYAMDVHKSTSAATSYHDYVKSFMSMSPCRIVNNHILVNDADAADNLRRYCDLSTNSERSLSALWGKLAADILTKNWDVALEELNRLKEIIDSKNFTSPLNQLQNRIWLMHWSIFIFFNHENGRNGIIDLFFQDRYLNAIQTNAPHLLGYLATAVVVNKRRRNMLKELVKVIQQEQHSYKDPITEFLECLFVNYDFDGAQQKLIECEQVILNDPFLGKRIEEGNFVTVPLRDEFLENAPLFSFETYFRIHRCTDIGVLSQKLNMSHDEVELWIMNLVRNSKLDAKIDLVSGTLIMMTNHVNT